jgi:patatin-like phospholipase/acyl hydrolase
MALRVLSLDGGGIRGIIPARVLVELEAITGRRVAELFDLIAGTATGGILALGLTAPGAGGGPRFRAADLLDFYQQSGHQLFPQPDPTHRLRHGFGLRAARHPGARPLYERFGDTPLGDAMVDLIVPTFDLAGVAPLLLRSEEFGAGMGPPMRDVALATSSVPTHFPSVDVELGTRTWALTHGAVVASNPAPFAYAEALAKSPPDQVVIVSLGTGARSGERGNGSTRSAKRWPPGAGRAFELQQEASAEAQHQLLGALLTASGQGERYWRLQPDLQPHPHEYGLTDPAALSHLADEFVTGTRPSLNEIADRLVV